MHYTHQCKAKISYLNSEVKSALCPIASLSQHPVTLVSPLPVSQLACQVSHDPLLLCLCFVLSESRTAGTSRGLTGFRCRGSMWTRTRRMFVSPSPSDCQAGPVAWPQCAFWCKLAEVPACQRGGVSGEHTGHIPEGSTGCDFSRPSQGFGYSVCLCELMPLPSQCLSKPVE